MDKSAVRKFSDLATGRESGPKKSALKTALQNIAKTEDGRVLEQHLLNILTKTLPLGAPEGALREAEASRRMSLELIRHMAPDESADANRRPAKPK